MCCLIASVTLVGPRLGIIVWWLMDRPRWEATFEQFISPLLGFLFLPWTTLAYVAVRPGGIEVMDWFILGFAFFIDLGSYSSSELGWRRSQSGGR